MYFLKSEFSLTAHIFYTDMKGNAAIFTGHRWKVEVTVKNAFLQRNGQNKGMIMDFSEL